MKKTSAIILAAGEGTRLMPLTSEWPKCLMPIHKVPLLEFWLSDLRFSGVREAIVNTCYHGDLVSEFLSRPRFKNWVVNFKEETLLGTAGTIRKNINLLRDKTVLMAHADNWSGFDLSKLLTFHRKETAKGSLITMLLFNTTTPESCGIVELNQDNIVTNMYEKEIVKRGNIANGAVYVIEPEVVNWITETENIDDFSLDVLPHFMGRISGIMNDSFHRDIGALPMLRIAQKDPMRKLFWKEKDTWQLIFEKNPVHKNIFD